MTIAIEALKHLLHSESPQRNWSTMVEEAQHPGCQLICLGFSFLPPVSYLIWADFRPSNRCYSVNDPGNEETAPFLPMIKKLPLQHLESPPPSKNPNENKNPSPSGSPPGDIVEAVPSSWPGGSEQLNLSLGFWQWSGPLLKPGCQLRLWRSWCSCCRGMSLVTGRWGSRPQRPVCRWLLSLSGAICA